MDPVRFLINQIVTDRSLKLKELSEAIGKNHAYMQQYLKRGIPAKLPEDIRRLLAVELGVDEAALGGPLRSGRKEDRSQSVTDEDGRLPDFVKLPEYDIRGGAAYAGGVDGAGDYNAFDVSAHKPIAQWGFPAEYVRSTLGLKEGSADIITVEGNSMDDGSRHSLISGDKVIIDLKSINIRQGGIFAVYDGATVIIKQVEYVRGTDPAEIICKSLNQSYSSFSVILHGNAHIIGRVAAKIMRM